MMMMMPMLMTTMKTSKKTPLIIQSTNEVEYLLKKKIVIPNKRHHLLAFSNNLLRKLSRRLKLVRTLINQVCPDLCWLNRKPKNNHNLQLPSTQLPNNSQIYQPNNQQSLKQDHSHTSSNHSNNMHLCQAYSHLSNNCNQNNSQRLRVNLNRKAAFTIIQTVQLNTQAEHLRGITLCS